MFFVTVSSIARWVNKMNMNSCVDSICFTLTHFLCPPQEALQHQAPRSCTCASPAPNTQRVLLSHFIYQVWVSPPEDLYSWLCAVEEQRAPTWWDWISHERCMHWLAQLRVGETHGNRRETPHIFLSFHSFLKNSPIWHWHVHLEMYPKRNLINIFFPPS